MSQADLVIVATMRDEATPKMVGMKNILADNKTAIRDLAMGASFLGSSFIGMGIALKQTNSELGKGAGQTLLMVGSIMTAVGSSVQFVRSISQMIEALKKLAIAEAVVKAFQGPAGWVALGVGAAVATGAVAGINAMSRAEGRAEKKVVIENKTILDGRQIGLSTRREIILDADRNGTSGVR